MCPGAGSCSLSSTTSSSRRQCDGGGRSGLFSLCNSSYSLWCPLWPPKVVPKEADIRGTCWYYWRRHIQKEKESNGWCYLLNRAIFYLPCLFLYQNVKRSTSQPEERYRVLFLLFLAIFSTKMKNHGQPIRDSVP